VATQLIGAVREVLVVPGEAEAVIALLAAPTTHVASFTITEKGYCRAADGVLDHALAGENSVYRYLAAGLRRRRDAGLSGITLLCCDNLANNGAQLARLMAEYLARHDPRLLDWFTAECTCPSTMVDRIVPATTAADRAELANRLGFADEAAVMTEPFSQWVIEDRFTGPRPRWERVGAELVTDVAPYETAKLRMLNGAHSLLAYLGLAHGHSFVHQAVADPAIRPLVEQLMLREAAPSIQAAPGQDLAGYARALLARFDNAALGHRLIQIAMDGSQKLPQRWLETLAWHQERGEKCPAILTGIAAWLLHVRGHARAVDDPLADRLAACWADCGRESVAIGIFGTGGLLTSDWQPGTRELATIAANLDRLGG
jgi:fructuronate reductase